MLCCHKKGWLDIECSEIFLSAATNTNQIKKQMNNYSTIRFFTNEAVHSSSNRWSLKILTLLSTTYQIYHDDVTVGLQVSTCVRSLANVREHSCTPVPFTPVWHHTHENFWNTSLKHKSPTNEVVSSNAAHAGFISKC